MTIKTADTHHCPTCRGGLYVAFATPVKLVHVSTDTTRCGTK